MDREQLYKIAKFFIKYSGYETDPDTVKQYILQHFDFKTAFVGFDDAQEVTFICRWNIIDEGKVAEILDLYIREEYRNKKMIQQLLKQGLWLFPTVKFIKFERQKKYPGREKHLIPVDRILKKE